MGEIGQAHVRFDRRAEQESLATDVTAKKVSTLTLPY
jgi:hypothetical protein